MKKISLTVKVSFAPLLKENIENEGGGFRTHYNNIPQIELHAFVTVCIPSDFQKITDSQQWN